MASAANKKPLEFIRKPTQSKSNASEPRRKDFLFYLANGHSIEQAYTLVGVTRKGKADWLPDPIPADTQPLAPYDEEQPDYLTNDFPSQPASSEFESTESQPASPQASAPKASAANLTPEAGSREPEAGQPLNPFTPTAHPSTCNRLQNKHNPVAEQIETPPPFSSNRFTSPAPTATASHGSPPESGSRNPHERQRAKWADIPEFYSDCINTTELNCYLHECRSSVSSQCCGE